MLSKLQKRLRNEEGGFTLIELLIVLVIIGILLAIVVPSYIGFKERAEKRAAESNLRSAVPSVEAYYSDNNTYGTGDITTTLRASYDQGISNDVTVTGGGTTYSVSSTKGSCTASFTGPGNLDTVATVCT